MSVAGIASSLLSVYNTLNVPSQKQQFQQEFQQLGQDLQSGNLSAAQTDFVTLQQSGPQATSTASAQSMDPIVQAFNQLSKDLQSGNTTAAQQDYATIQQDFQNQATQSQGHISDHHHHHGVAEVSRMRSARCSSGWARICSQANCRRRSRPTARCSRTCNNSPQPTEWPRLRVAPARAAFR